MLLVTYPSKYRHMIKECQISIEMYTFTDLYFFFYMYKQIHSLYTNLKD